MFTRRTGPKTRFYTVILFCAIASRGAAQSDPAAELAPVRNGLRAVPLPRLEELEPAVSGQIREEERSFQSLRDTKNLSSAALAGLYGSLARLFHAYEFFESAEASYLNAARLAPGDVTWPHLLGYLYQQTGRLEEAADRFEEARRIRLDDHAATVRLGQVYLGMNRLREAREQFESVSAIFPALAHSGLGEVALRERRFQEAIAHFRAALERVPQASSIHYSLAMAYRGLGRLDEARSHLQQQGTGGIAIGDPIVDGLQTLVRGERLLVIHGRRAYEAGRFQDAADAFRKAIAVAPTSVSAHFNLGLALSQLGDTSGALEHLRLAFDQSPDDTSISSALVRALVRLERQDEAIEVQTRARLLAPDDEDALVSLSILLAHRERYREAIAVLEDGHRRFPDRTPTATTLARLLASSPDLSLRDGRRALELAMAVYATSPTPADGETIALALAELGRCDQALEWMRRAVADANRAGDATETTRLTGELPRYEAASCRAPAR